MKVMLLCAGEGTRLRPHTLKLPKPAIPFLTVPMGAYSVEWAREVSPERLVVNTFHLPERIHSTFKAMDHGFSDLRFSDEQPMLMGPGGGIKKAEPLLSGGDFLVMNGDEIFLPSSEGQLLRGLESHRGHRPLATILVMKYPGVGTKFGGVWADARGNVVGFGKDPRPGTEGWHFTGSIFFSPEIFRFLPADRPSNILYDGLTAAIAQGLSVRIETIDGWWHETGSPDDYLKATADAIPSLTEDRGYASLFLRKILKRHSPKASATRMNGAVFLSADGTPPANFSLEGFGILGHGSSFAAGSKNKNAVLGDGVIADSAVVEALRLG